MTHQEASSPDRPIRFVRRALGMIVLLELGLGFMHAPSARAMPIVEFAHITTTDPEDVAEGWTRLGLTVPGVLDQGLADVEIGPVDPDCSACGLTAWGIDDRSGVAGSTLRYEQTASPQQVSDADAMGWTLRVRVRIPADEDNQVPQLLDPVDASVMAEFREGSLGGQRRFRILFGANEYGPPLVALSGASGEYFDQFLHHAHYGLYELMYRPDLGAATLFVDGVERLSGYVGEMGIPGGEGVAWGSDSEAGLGRGHFNLVEWEIGLPACFDGVDNDGDGLFDLSDPSCMNDQNGATEDHGTQCDDGLDNDGDGAVDLADPSCINDPTQTTEDLGTACDDHIDNDGDGQIDLGDPTCAGDPRNVLEVTACDDGVDNDGDGRVDLFDAGCLADVTRDSEAGEILVNTTLDKPDADGFDGICETDVPGECSLRAAILHSFREGVKGIQLPTGDYDVDLPYTGSSSTGGALTIRGDVALIGDGATLTKIGPATPTFSDSIIRIFPIDATISGVTVRGSAGSSGIYVVGGGSSPGDITFSDITISGNASPSSGGGLSVSGDSHVKLIRSLISGNTAMYHGGGLTNGNFSILDVIDSTISGNSAEITGGGNLDGRVTIINSTISGNTSFASHGVGGLFFRAGLHHVINSTFSGNVGSSGGALMSNEANLTLTNVTSTDNTPNGVCAWTDLGTPYIENSIIAGNNGVDCGFPASPPTSLGHNLSGDASCLFGEVGDLENTAPMLGPLADNGGATLTHLLLAGSPAIDAADATTCPATGQRGVGRPQDGDGDSLADCDIGAVEVVPEPAGMLPLALGCCLIARLGRRASSR